MSSVSAVASSAMPAVPDTRRRPDSAGSAGSASKGGSVSLPQVSQRPQSAHSSHGGGGGRDSARMPPPPPLVKQGSEASQPSRPHRGTASPSSLPREPSLQSAALSSHRRDTPPVVAPSTGSPQHQESSSDTGNASSAVAVMPSVAPEDRHQPAMGAEKGAGKAPVAGDRPGKPGQSEGVGKEEEEEDDDDDDLSEMLGDLSSVTEGASEIVPGSHQQPKSPKNLGRGHPAGVAESPERPHAPSLSNRSLDAIPHPEDGDRPRSAGGGDMMGSDVEDDEEEEETPAFGVAVRETEAALGQSKKYTHSGPKVVERGGHAATEATQEQTSHVVTIPENEGREEELARLCRELGMPSMFAKYDNTYLLASSRGEGPDLETLRGDNTPPEEDTPLPAQPIIPLHGTPKEPSKSSVRRESLISSLTSVSAELSSPLDEESTPPHWKRGVALPVKRGHPAGTGVTTSQSVASSRAGFASSRSGTQRLLVNSSKASARGKRKGNLSGAGSMVNIQHSVSSSADFGSGPRYFEGANGKTLMVETKSDPSSGVKLVLNSKLLCPMTYGESGTLSGNVSGRQSLHSRGTMGSQPDPNHSEPTTLQDWEQILDTATPQPVDPFTFFELICRNNTGVHQGTLVVPDTVVYNYRQPAAWYYTNDEGYFARVDPRDLTIDNIIHGFCHKEDPNKGPIIALHVFATRDGKIRTEYFDKERFLWFVRHADDKSGYLQKFVYPPTERNTMTKISWRSKVMTLEKRVNVHLLSDSMLEPDERAFTFDGPEVHSMPAETKQTAVRSKLEAIGYFVTSLISNTVLSHNRIRGGVPTAAVVCKLTFYVKPMAQGRWALLYASHLHLAQNVQSVNLPSLPPKVVLNSSLEESIVKAQRDRQKGGATHRLRMKETEEQDRRIEQRAMRERKRECPRCGRLLESKDKFEVTYDAVLRHYCKILENPKGGNLFRRHSDNILDFGTWEYLTESGYSLFVPLLIHKSEPRLKPSLFHNINDLNEEFLKLLADPSFLQRTIYLCEDCVLHLHDSTFNEMVIVEDLTAPPAPMFLKGRPASKIQPRRKQFPSVGKKGAASNTESVIARLIKETASSEHRRKVTETLFQGEELRPPQNDSMEEGQNTSSVLEGSLSTAVDCVVRDSGMDHEESRSSSLHQSRSRSRSRTDSRSRSLSSSRKRSSRNRAFSEDAASRGGTMPKIWDILGMRSMASASSRASGGSGSPAKKGGKKVRSSSPTVGSPNESKHRDSRSDFFETAEEFLRKNRPFEIIQAADEMEDEMEISTTTMSASSKRLGQRGSSADLVGVELSGPSRVSGTTSHRPTSSVSLPRLMSPELMERTKRTALDPSSFHFSNPLRRQNSYAYKVSDAFNRYSQGGSARIVGGSKPNSSRSQKNSGRAIQLPMMRVPSMEAGELNLSMRSNGGPSGAVQVESDSKQPNRVRKATFFITEEDGQMEEILEEDDDFLSS